MDGIRRFALKAATANIHAELDRRLSGLDLAAPDDYAKFLDFHARTIPALEQALASAGLGDLVEGWRDGLRARRIEKDLTALGRLMPAPAPPPEMKGTPQQLGAAYVLEGSRLGSAVLRKAVPEQLPSQYLNDESRLGPWPELLKVIDRHVCSDSDLKEAEDAAQRTFNWLVGIADEAGIQ